MAKRFNRIAAVALSVALLSTSTAGIIPQAAADSTVTDATSWKYAMAEDFEASTADGEYETWGGYSEVLKGDKDYTTNGIIKENKGANNSKGLYVRSLKGVGDSAYCQPYYAFNKAGDFAGATELWIWYDYSNYQKNGALTIRPTVTTPSGDVDLRMRAGAPIYIQNADGSFKYCTLTADTTDEAPIKAEDLAGLKGYIRIPLSSFNGNGKAFVNTGITKLSGGYFMYDHSFITDAGNNFVENGFTIDNVLFAGQDMNSTATVKSLLGLDVNETDKKAADAVSAKIAALPAKADVTLGKKADVEAARAEYDKLSDSAKKLVDTTKLTTAETQIKILTAAADPTTAAVIKTAVDKINGLPSSDKLTIANKTDVEAARIAYNAVLAMTFVSNSADVAQSLVTNYAVLTKAESTMTTLIAAEEASKVDKDTAAPVIAAIAALPTTILPANSDAVTAAKTAYESLTPSQKAIVTNYSILEAAINKLAAFAKRSADDPDPSWNYLSLADFENLQTGYAFSSEADSASTSSAGFKYMNEPNGKNDASFKSVVAKNGFKGTNAWTVQGIDATGSYAQPLLRVDQLNGSKFKDYSGATEMVLYVDFSNIKLDTIGVQFRFMENDIKSDGATSGSITQWGLSKGAYVYIQDSTGKWVKVYNDKSGFKDASCKLPVEVTGRAASDKDGLAAVAGYKGMVRIPLSQFTNVDATPAKPTMNDPNGKMDLQQVTQVWTVFQLSE